MGGLMDQTPDRRRPAPGGGLRSLRRSEIVKQCHEAGLKIDHNSEWGALVREVEGLIATGIAVYSGDRISQAKAAANVVSVVGGIFKKKGKK